MTRPRKLKHGGRRKGAGRPVTSERTARLVVRVEPAILEAAAAAVGGGKALADVVRGYLRGLGKGAIASATPKSLKGGSGDQ